jgi:hypothetical protein
MGHRINAKGSRLLIDMLEGKISEAELRAQMVVEDMRPKPCQPGEHGVCLAHGQLLVDCSDEDYK